MTMTSRWSGMVEALAESPRQKRFTLKEARTLRQLTQEQLAERAGMQQSDISAIERGRREQPEIATIAKLSTALGMDGLLSVAGLVFEEKSS